MAVLAQSFHPLMELRTRFYPHPLVEGNYDSKNDNSKSSKSRIENKILKSRNLNNKMVGMIQQTDRPFLLPQSMKLPQKQRLRPQVRLLQLLR